MSTIGRQRRTVALMIASHCDSPAQYPAQSDQLNQEMRMIIPDKAIVPSIATKPKGLLNSNREQYHTDNMPSSAVKNPDECRDMLRAES